LLAGSLFSGVDVFLVSSSSCPLTLKEGSYFLFLFSGASPFVGPVVFLSAGRQRHSFLRPCDILSRYLFALNPEHFFPPPSFTKENFSHYNMPGFLPTREASLPQHRSRLSILSRLSFPFACCEFLFHFPSRLGRCDWPPDY